MQNLTKPSKRLPERTCRVCRRRAAKPDLERWVLSPKLTADPAKTLPGRGLYTCSPNCAAVLPDIIKKRGR